MALRDGDETIGLCRFQTPHNVLPAESAIDEHHCGAATEQGEDQRDEFDARFHQQRDAMSGANAHGDQALRQAIGIGIEIGKRDVLPPTPIGRDDRHRSGPRSGMLPQTISHIATLRQT